MRGKLFSKSLQVGQGDFRCQYGGGLRQWLAEVVEDDAVAAVVDAVAVFTDTVYTNVIAEALFLAGIILLYCSLFVLPMGRLLRR